MRCFCMTQADRAVIGKMIGYCDDVTDLIAEFGDSYDIFSKQKSFRYAASMCILQIGELVNRLSPDILQENVQIPWRMIRAMRNVFAHSYESADMDIMWETVKEDIPSLKRQLSGILASAEGH